MLNKLTVDIDIGGTLTDGLFSDGENIVAVKVDTTPHDFTVCFFDCLREGAERLEYDDMTQFMANVKVIRWSSTIATNVLAEGKGPKNGLLISEGYNSDLYGSDVSPAIGKVLASENIVPVSEPLEEEEVLKKVRELLEKGVRRICVSLKGSFQHPESEQKIKKFIQEQFPDHYLGAVPVLLGSDIVHHPDDQTRTHLALINSYVHTPLAVALFKAEDQLQQEFKYRKPVYIGHVNGGVARVAKTKGVDTTESGPVFGLHAAAYFARQYGFNQVLSVDVGGTTTKIGLILNGEVINVPHGDLFDIPLKTPWVLLHSISLGGGSIAGIAGGKITLGPKSMGAYPGPACYDLGGDQATLTDAFVLVGAMNPDRFLGGRRQLNIEQARIAIIKHVAEPLNITVEAAAQGIVDTAMDMVTQACSNLLKEHSYTSDNFNLFTFGGNGSNFATGVAERLNIEEAYVFGYGPVLSAFGSSVSDISHIHEEWPYITLKPEELNSVTAIIAGGRDQVLRDFEGEGLGLSMTELTVELVLEGQSGDSKVVKMTMTDALNGGLSKTAADLTGMILERVSIQGNSPVARVELPRTEAISHQAEPYQQRKVLWPKPNTAQIYNWETLAPGGTFMGPACLESETVSCTVIPGWKVQIDGLGNAVMSKGGR